MDWCYTCVSKLFIAQDIYSIRSKMTDFLLLLILVYTYLVYVHICFVFSHFFSENRKTETTSNLTKIKDKNI